MRLETLAIHAGGEADAATGALTPPIHLATTFRHGPAAERVAGYEYQREGDPTNDRLRAAIAALEGAETALTFASGMAAIAALLESLPAGARILVPDDCYTGLRILAAEFLPGRGIEVVTVDMTDLTAVRNACNGGIALIWAETPSNPLLAVSDIAALAAIAREHDALLVCDNTFASPVLQQPLALGADVVMHSTTKYFGGHSDVLGGALAFARAGTDTLFERVAHRLHITGATLAPFSAWLTLRGCRSLPARMTMHCANARRVAEFLSAQPQVERVHYPGLDTHPGHAVAARQMRDFGGMLSIELRGGRDTALGLAGAVRLFTNATSLGGCESLIEHRASVEGERPVSPPGLLRLSVGLEHIEDLIDDLRQGLTGT
ncbi:trans-sulfuration enzyme family protein [Luteimonas salinilitoris]|uniref:PLP-dependent aspartate aminotransferase family protein n=1 Tax=Luteimonas salinilitoris TaxID=3237697 RepID=A0ABV4HVN0_9GAMM